MKVELLFITPDSEKLIEKIGRVSRLSFDKMEKGSEEKFIKMLLKLGHHSVFEHAYASFMVSDCSRSFTHQLVRHRLASYLQQSQRYVDESNFNFITPNSIKGNKEALELYKNFMEKAKETYKNLLNLGIPKEDARFILPNATESKIVITANFREWRHIIELRGSKDAQWEIRNFAIEVLKILKNYAPNVFCDFEIDEENKVIKKIEI